LEGRTVTLAGVVGQSGVWLMLYPDQAAYRYRLDESAVQLRGSKEQLAQLLSAAEGKLVRMNGIVRTPRGADVGSPAVAFLFVDGKFFPVVERTRLPNVPLREHVED
jgi:hypothetical protein